MDYSFKMIGDYWHVIAPDGCSAKYNEKGRFNLNTLIEYKRDSFVTWAGLTNKQRQTAFKSKDESKIMEITTSTYCITTNRGGWASLTSTGLFPVCEEKEEKQMRTQEQEARDYLNGRANTIYYNKVHAAEKAFHLYADESPDTGKELVERIQQGKFTLRAESDDCDCYHYGPLSDIIWRDPAVKKDQEGYLAAYEAMQKVLAETKDQIMVSDAAAGLKAVQDFEARTFH